MSDTEGAPTPKHIAIIPDGNRRWAKQRGLKTKDGHKEGYETLKRTAYAAFERGVPYLTAFAFSTENWSRTAEEVSFLMSLVAWVVSEEAEDYHRRGIRLRILGSHDGLNAKLAKSLDQVQELTANNTKGNLNLCFNYGGRDDLLRAIRKLINDGVKAEDIDEAAVSAALSSHGLPDPDLIIRTSGERRLSNYLMWESVYSELYFSDKLWPDFDTAELDKALADYAERKRNFGK